jgi:hypothetical protein
VKCQAFPDGRFISSANLAKLESEQSIRRIGRWRAMAYRVVLVQPGALLNIACDPDYSDPNFGLCFPRMRHQHPGLQLRFRGVGAGRKLNLLRELQVAPRAANIRPHYTITIHERSSFDAQLRTVPTFVLEQMVGSSGGKEIQLSGRQVVQAEEPYGSLYLLFLNYQHVTDMCLFNGAAIRNGHLVVDTHGKRTSRF